MSALLHPLLESIGVEHGFGTRDARVPEGLQRPRQVHGVVVARAGTAGLDPAEADAVVSATPRLGIAVVTADCVPVLAASRDGAAVAAIHAGWRGLAAGVVEAGIAGLRELAAAPLVAAIGPHIGPCCYEVDAPVLRALAPRFGAALDDATHPTRPGHVRLHLAALVRASLVRAGLAVADVGDLEAACTRCNPQRFHSYRRDGPRSGRLVHYVIAGEGGRPRFRVDSAHRGV